MNETRPKSICRSVRYLLVAGSAMWLASCTVPVSELAPDPLDGEHLTLVLDVMAASAKDTETSDPQRAEKAVNAVTVWRGTSESSGGETP